MTEEVKTIKLKWLAIAREGIDKLREENDKLMNEAKSLNKPLKEQYKLMDQYSKKVKKLLEGINKKGLDEIAKLDNPK